jgi:hypothetical protein
MKKTLAALAALAMAVLSLAGQETNTNAMNNVVVCVPTNIPPAIVQAELVMSARRIAAVQIEQSTLAQLETANTNLPTMDDSNLLEAQQILLLKVRSTSDVNKLNALIASLPPPNIRTNEP